MGEFSCFGLITPSQTHPSLLSFFTPMNLHVIDAGHFKLDGGAMFGVVPKTIWNRLVPADENNLCSWDMRCLLVEDGNRLMLIDTGMGDKQDPKWQAFYYRHGEGELVKSIEKAGFGAHEVTDVIFSHLHLSLIHI